MPIAGKSRRERLIFLARLVAMLLVLRVVIGIVIGYHDYFPPNFYSEFLTGRRSYFYGWYQVAFWIHILVSPIVVFGSVLLLATRLHIRQPILHRWLGRVHTTLVLALVAPSGLWMSCYALTGWWAGSAFAIASVATFGCAWMGWRNAIKRDFASHRAWMTRCFLLLCSAIILRLLSGAATLTQSSELWTYPVFAWISTTIPIAIYETTRVFSNARRRMV